MEIGGRPIRRSAKRPPSSGHAVRKLQSQPRTSPHALTLLAYKHEAHSKSVTGFNQIQEDEKINLPAKQAWAPTPKSNLASRSFYSPVYADPVLPPLPRTRNLDKTTDGSVSLVTASKPREGSERSRSNDAFGRVEDHLLLQDLIKLRKRFEGAGEDGKGTLDIDQFISVFDQLFVLKGQKEAEILTFFNKIDYDCDNSITWDKFCTYMYLEYQKRDLTENMSKEILFNIPAQPTPDNPHNETICRISHLTDGSLVTCGVDGVLCLWTGDYRPKRIRKTEPGYMGKSKWITDMSLCIPQSKILLTTGDREIQFYDMIKFEPYCQLRRLDSLPLSVAFWFSPIDPNQCIILLGDQEGTVTVITTENILEAFKHWKLGTKNCNGMPTFPINKLAADESASGTKVYRWKLHSHWVTEVHYFPSLHCFASCSSDPNASLVLGSPTGSTPVESILQSSYPSSSAPFTGRQFSMAPGAHIRRPTCTSAKTRSVLPAKNRMIGDQRVFRVPKGVSTVDYCHKNNALVTGGVDEIIRIWNPFINSKPIALLYGQDSPVFSVMVDSEEDRIFCIGNNNTIKVWHTLDLTCLCTLVCRSHNIYSTVQAFHFNQINSLIAIGTDNLFILNICSKTKKRLDITQSHTHPVTGLKYSHCFDQVVTACEGSVLKVWDVFSGKKVFEYQTDLGEDAGVSALDVDYAGKRIVTGGHSGQIKVWNYNNGQCVSVLDKGNSSEVSDIKFVTIKNKKYIIAVGWDRKISIFMDTPTNQTITSSESWSNASEHTHSEDTLCVAFGSPHLMATASFDGEIIVWSVIACRIISHLKPSPSHHPTAGHHTGAEKESMRTNLTTMDAEAIHKVLFLDTRSKSKIAANLVASGPAGCVHFWNVYDTSGPMGKFSASTATVTSMAVDSTDTVLVTGESLGHICTWSITDYCMTTRCTDAPKRITLWRGHTNSVSCVELVPERNVIVSAAVDGTVRIWTLEGHYIGSFGQKEEWFLGNPSTYQHPLTPRDVFTNFDLPSTLLIKKTQSPKVAFDSQENETRGTVGTNIFSEDSKEAVSAVTKTARRESRQVQVMETDQEDDEDILLQSHISVNIPLDESLVGKRLRHLRSNSAVRKRPGTPAAGVYTTIPFQSLTDETHLISNILPPDHTFN